MCLTDMMLSKYDGYLFHLLQTCMDHTHVGDAKIAPVELWNFPFEKTVTMPKKKTMLHTHTQLSVLSYLSRMVLHTHPRVAGRDATSKLACLRSKSVINV